MFDHPDLVRVIARDRHSNRLAAAAEHRLARESSTSSRAQRRLVRAAHQISGVDRPHRRAPQVGPDVGTALETPRREQLSGARALGITSIRT